MKFPAKIGTLLLAIFLLVVGIAAFVPINGVHYITGGLAIAAGVFILIDR